MKQFFLSLGGTTQAAEKTYPTPSDPAPTVTVVSTKTVTQDPSKWYARASTWTMNNGVVVLTYLHRTDHGIGSPTIHIRFSEDYGQTWTAEDHFTDGLPVVGFPYTAKGYHLQRVIQCPNGDLVVLRRPGDTGTNKRSTDGGKTWVGFTPTYPALDPDDYGQELRPFDMAIVLGNRVYCPSKQWSGANMGYTGHIPYVNRLKWHYSDDNCATFQTTGKVISTWPIPPINDNLVGANPPTKGADEPLMIYTGNGLFRFAGRITDVTGFYGMECPNYGYDDVTISDLSSQINWAAGRLTGSQRAKFKNGADWWNDPVIFAFGFEFVTPGLGNGRRHCIIYSKDKGVTWSGPIYLDQTYFDGGYGDVFYDFNKDEYVFVSYIEENSGDKAYLKQYNVKIDWE